MRTSELEKQRARTGAEKDARKATLVAAARTMLEDMPFDDIKIADVAKAAGLAKGTAYLYFSSKEALFLSVMWQELDDWFATLEAALADTPPAGDRIAWLARLMARSLAEKPVARSLLANLHSRLESNASDDEVKSFKLFLAERVRALSGAVERAAQLTEGSGPRVFLVAYALVIGIGQLSDPPANVRRIIESDARLHFFLPDFESEYAIAFEGALRGLASGTS